MDTSGTHILVFILQTWHKVGKIFSCLAHTPTLAVAPMRLKYGSEESTFNSFTAGDELRLVMEGGVGNVHDEIWRSGCKGCRTVYYICTAYCN